MSLARPLVAIVDDDESVRESLPDLLRVFGFDAATFSSADAFLASPTAAQAACLILDVAMPGMTGPELQQELKRRGSTLRIVFITAQGDDRDRRRLLAAGAVAYLQKPFSESALLDALDLALKPRTT